MLAGGASLRSLSYATAEQFAEHGAKVVKGAFYLCLSVPSRTCASLANTCRDCSTTGKSTIRPW